LIMVKRIKEICMNKKWINSLIVTSLVSLLIVGCGSDSDSGSSGESTTTSTEATYSKTYIAQDSTSTYAYSIGVTSYNDEFLHVSIYGESTTMDNFQIIAAYMIDTSDGLENISIPAVFENTDQGGEYNDEIAVTLASDFSTVSINTELTELEFDSLTLEEATYDGAIISLDEFLNATFSADAIYTDDDGNTYAIPSVNDVRITDEGTLYVQDDINGCWIEADVYSSGVELYQFYAEIIDSNCDYTVGQAGVVHLEEDETDSFDIDYTVTAYFPTTNFTVLGTSFITL